jgi:hypothetical protein
LRQRAESWSTPAGLPNCVRRLRVSEKLRVYGVESGTDRLSVDHRTATCRRPLHLRPHRGE